MKRFLYYLFATLIIGFIFYAGASYQEVLQEKMSKRVDMTMTLILSTVLFVLGGMILRLPRLILEIKDGIDWGVDWRKLIAIGIPVLYVALMPLLSFSPLGASTPLSFKLINHPVLIRIAGIVFGYVLLDSLKNSKSSDSLFK